MPIKPKKIIKSKVNPCKIVPQNYTFSYMIKSKYTKIIKWINEFFYLCFIFVVMPLHINHIALKASV